MPEPTLVERSHRLSPAFTGNAALSWPIWRGRTGVMPTLGVRWFAPERGVRLDGIEQFSLHGLSPRIALALVALTLARALVRVADRLHLGVPPWSLR